MTKRVRAASAADAKWLETPREYRNSGKFYGIAHFWGKDHVLTADSVDGPWFMGKRPVTWTAKTNWYCTDVVLDFDRGGGDERY